MKELKESFDEMEQEGRGKGSLKPERLTRAGAREAEANVASGADGGEEPAEEGSSDLRLKLFTVNFHM